jgi:hypothetical protein
MPIKLETPYENIEVTRIVSHRNGSCASFYTMEFRTEAPIRGTTEFFAVFEAIELEDETSEVETYKVEEVFVTSPASYSDGNPYYAMFRGTGWIADAAAQAVARYTEEFIWILEIVERPFDGPRPDPDDLEESLDVFRRRTIEGKKMAAENYDFQVIDSDQWFDARLQSGTENLIASHERMERMEARQLEMLQAKQKDVTVDLRPE